ncbi:type I restriction enzyme HsdR N-terminal domain-containing protein [Lentiprolixibacter aurantiacus]|uniref:Type I restriction enzyme HsdR N-terminal domain-containing protein n=1 Tax=Lentiprolixibacter aurantiacus TaxID=2993939 RepID=A0AAE3SPQ8_9FLAO|nr:type I restriction enzyme HsdR N-terminal domain-containing protein [Lentiprolixibacter aurantiacus]MCX2719687.1 type I restriction enzyme HsdR N-terminal domain-containing protein [Lentiprolixibacter aurantiacus]
MKPLCFPQYDFRFKSSENTRYIFDVIRKKFVVLQPEEWVRQHLVHYLIKDKGYPKSLINVEKIIRMHGLSKRYDLVVFSPLGEIVLLAECKAPNIPITQETFDQIARYNMALQSRLLVLTNGAKLYCCEMDFDKEKYIFLEQIPEFSR